MNNVENICVRYWHNTNKSNILYDIIMERAKKLLEEDCKNIVKRYINKSLFRKFFNKLFGLTYDINISLYECNLLKKEMVFKIKIINTCHMEYIHVPFRYFEV